MKKLIIIALIISLIGCDSPNPECTDKSHEWTKWKTSDQKSIGGSAWMSRECEKCGWRQERGAQLP